MKAISPLRYPGGKRKLTNYIKLVLTENGLVGCTFVEPFAGGASVGLTLLMHNYVDSVHLNDLNPNIFYFWKAVFEDTDELCKRIAETKISIEEWHKQKGIYNNPADCCSLDLAFSTFFLNRTCRSGVLSGGVIGGLSQTGAWKIDARFNKFDLIKRIQKLGRLRSKVYLYNKDAVKFIYEDIPRLPKTTLLYLDPPYIKTGGCLYDYSYNQEDHKRLPKALESFAVHHWIVSYDDLPEINSLYINRKSLKFKLGYSINNSEFGNEALFFSDDINIPDIESPLDVIAVA